MAVVPCRLFLPLAMALPLVAAAAAVELGWERLPPAKQQGPSCAFFANIPALALATGVDISSSEAFVREVYGLRRGDFRFERSFDKRIFCELFALPWSETTVRHPELPRTELQPFVRELITRQWDAGLEKGWVFSLRSNGRHGGPHNILLLARTDDGYVVHNPNPGWIRTLSAEALADLVLVRSTRPEFRKRPVHITQFVTIELDRRAATGDVQPLKSLPAEPFVELSPDQRQRLARQLAPAVPDTTLTTTCAARIQSYPALNLAAMQREDDREPGNVIGGHLKPQQLAGVLSLARFHLSLYQLGRRRLLPVVFMEGRPWAMVACQSTADGLELAFDDGGNQRRLGRREAIDRIHADGAVFGTVELE